MLDYSRGFGGRYGVEDDRQDTSALGWDHIEQVERHGSQQGKPRLTQDLPDMLDVVRKKMWCQ